MKTWLVVGLAACGKAPNRIPDPRPLDLAAINALVPDSLKADLVFEAAQLEISSDYARETFAVAMPKDWVGERTGPLAIELHAPNKLGTFTKLRIGIGAGGDGDKPQDWHAVSRKSELDLSKSITIEKDEHSPTDHLLVYTNDTIAPRFHIIYVWWRPGGTAYYSCMATVDGPATQAEAAFEHVCKSITVASKS